MLAASRSSRGGTHNNPRGRSSIAHRFYTHHIIFEKGIYRFTAHARKKDAATALVARRRPKKSAKLMSLSKGGERVVRHQVLFGKRSKGSSQSEARCVFVCRVGCVCCRAKACVRKKTCGGCQVAGLGKALAGSGCAPPSRVGSHRSMCVCVRQSTCSGGGGGRQRARSNTYTRTQSRGRVMSRGAGHRRSAHSG